MLDWAKHLATLGSYVLLEKASVYVHNVAFHFIAALAARPVEGSLAEAGGRHFMACRIGAIACSHDLPGNRNLHR